MADVAAVRGTNGYRVVSTFSGCGGSCLGFEMAGFEIVLASEFVDAAADVYELNHPGVPVDRHDIRTISADDIISRTGLDRGEVDVLEGSPPCASFSMSGKRAAKWGEISDYSEKTQRTDDLFFEFARILRDLQPRTFVAENVAGLVRGVAKGYFKAILRELRDCGYDVEARLINAEWLGVPQARSRLIFVGVRTDLDRQPRFPAPLPYRYSINDACPWITNRGTDKAPKVADPEEAAPSIVGYALEPAWRKLSPGQSSNKYFNLSRPDANSPLPTVTALGGSNPGVASVTHPSVPRKFSIPELKRLSGFPADFTLTGSFSQRWERIGRSVPPLMMRTVADQIASLLESVDS